MNTRNTSRFFDPSSTMLFSAMRKRVTRDSTSTTRKLVDFVSASTTHKLATFTADSLARASCYGLIVAVFSLSMFPQPASAQEKKPTAQRVKELEQQQKQLAQRFGKLEELFIRMSELEAAANALAALRSRTRVRIQAATNRTEADFEEVAGVAWSAGKRRSGTPKRPSGTAAHESRVLKGLAAKKAAA